MDTNEAYMRENCEIVIGDDWIRVWFDDEHHQDILYSEEAANAIRNGANPIDEGWEDGCGNVVCKANSIEANETAYVVLDMMNDMSHEWSSDLFETDQEAVEEAEREWNHLTDGEKKKRHIIAGRVARDYKSENPVDDGIYDVFWDSEELGTLEEATMVVSLRTEGRASIKCTVTELARRIGADVGDQVLITMKKL